MVYEEFVEMMKSAKDVSNPSLDYKKVHSLLQDAKKIGIKKMNYEHPGQAAWKRRWENVPAQFSSRFNWDGI